MTHVNPKRARSGSIELEYEELGDGTRPFVLVHGFTGSRDDFREQLPDLARHGHTVAVDQRGHGGSDNPGEGYTLEQLTTDLLGFLDSLPQPGVRVVRLAAALLARETHPYAAAGALGALRGRPRRELVMEGGPELVVALLRFADHEHPTVSAYAREVLCSMPPVKLGAQLDRYEGWWRRGEGAFVREQRTLLEEHARISRASAELGGEQGASSVAPKDKTKEFYGRLETMRKHGLELCIVMDDTGSMRPVISCRPLPASGSPGTRFIRIPRSSLRRGVRASLRLPPL